jgi:hypothetical protein
MGKLRLSLHRHDKLAVAWGGIAPDFEYNHQVAFNT